MLLDPHDDGAEPRVLFMLGHSVREATSQGDAAPRDASRRLQFVEMNARAKPPRRPLPDIWI